MMKIIRHLPFLILISNLAKAQEVKTAKDSLIEKSAVLSDTCVQTIEGRVLDYYTEKPVNRAIVRAWYKGQSSRTAARTNANGYYKIKVSEPTVFDSLTVKEPAFGFTTLRGRITVGCDTVVKLPFIELKYMASGCIGIGRVIIYDENKPPIDTGRDVDGRRKKRRKK